MMNVQEEILKIKNEMIDEFDKRVEALKVDEQEFPQDSDEYWYIDNDGDILNERWDGLDFEEYRLAVGNIFKTKDQARFAAEKLKVEAELRKFSRPFESVKFNHYIFFYIDGNSVEVGCKTGCHSQGIIYFESEEKAQQAIDTVGVERIKKYIFEVED